MDYLTITASAAQWLTTAFMLTMAVIIPITGFLLQRFNPCPDRALLDLRTFASKTFTLPIAHSWPCSSTRWRSMPVGRTTVAIMMQTSLTAAKVLPGSTLT